MGNAQSQVTVLTTDHVPMLPTERQRIEANGQSTLHPNPLSPQPSTLNPNESRPIRAYGYIRRLSAEAKLSTAASAGGVAWQHPFPTVVNRFYLVRIVASTVAHHYGLGRGNGSSLSRRAAPGSHEKGPRLYSRSGPPPSTNECYIVTVTFVFIQGHPRTTQPVTHSTRNCDDKCDVII